MSSDTIPIVHERGIITIVIVIIDRCVLVAACSRRAVSPKTTKKKNEDNR